MLFHRWNLSMPAFVLLNNSSMHCVNFLKLKFRCLIFSIWAVQLVMFYFLHSEIVLCYAFRWRKQTVFFFLLKIVFLSVSINVLLISMKSKVLLIRKKDWEEYNVPHVLKHGIYVASLARKTRPLVFTVLFCGFHFSECITAAKICSRSHDSVQSLQWALVW